MMTSQSLISANLLHSHPNYKLWQQQELQLIVMAP
jgi:hypothetical protein